MDKFQLKCKILRYHNWLLWRSSENGINDGWVNPVTLIHYNSTEEAFDALALHNLTTEMYDNKK